MTHVEHKSIDSRFDKDRNMAATAPKFLSVWDIRAY